MLQRNSRTVIHPTLGTITLKPKFAQVLELPFFREMLFKNQLGSLFLGKKFLNANHNRLMHSIGVMYLTEKLLDTCEKKFSRYFSISTKDREILEFAALSHDIGHLPFSHSIEDKEIKSHEQRTIEILQNNSAAINTIFGYDIVSPTVQVLLQNQSLKANGYKAEEKGKLDILFIFKSLLAGAIDCDRMEYIMTDHYMVYGKSICFTDIFRYITIVLLNDAPTLGFEKEAVPLIEDFLLHRFDEYRYIIYEEDAILVEIVLRKYMQERNFTEEQVCSITQCEILADLMQTLRNPKYRNTPAYRYAQIILEGNRSQILFRKFEDQSSYEHFLRRLRSITSKDVVQTLEKEIHIYDPKKHKIYIKDSNGLVKDIMEVSSKIRAMSLGVYFVMVDLEEAITLTPQEVSFLTKLFMDNPIEIEKKFILSDGNMLLSSPASPNTWDTCQEIMKELLSSMQPAVQNIYAIHQIQNEDQYYVLFAGETIIPNIAVRHRKTQTENCYYVKVPVDDGTSITKRYEYKYENCSGLEELLEHITLLLESQKIKIDAPLRLVAGIQIVTNRYQYPIEILDSLVEISCDFSNYYYQGKSSSGIMIECELKQGEELSLWFLENKMKALGFIQTNASKETRAKNALGISPF